jgi:glycosyltransferase involved in cell wall biosynthesis
VCAGVCELLQRPRIAAIIPVLDEEGAIGPVVAAIPRDWVGEVIVVDGGSGDGTIAEAKAAGATVFLASGRGYGRACAEGVAMAMKREAAVLVFLDGDGSDRPEVLPRLVQPILEENYEFVIGSRTRGERQRGSMGVHQAVAGRLIGAAIGFLYGSHFSDMCAFRAIRTDALQRLGMREMTYGWNLEMQIRAARAGLRILELPVPHASRIAGKSKVAGSFRGTLRAGYRILLTFARIVLERR